MKRNQRFPVVMSQTERAMLQRLAAHERISGAAVVRRLVWREAERLNITVDQHDVQMQTQARQGVST